MTSFSYWISLPSKSYKRDARVGPGGRCKGSGFQSRLRDPQVRKCQSSVKANLPNVCPTGRHYLHLTRQQTDLPSAMEGDTSFIFQGYGLYKHPWKGSQKLTMPLCRRQTETQATHGELSSNNSFVTISNMIASWLENMVCVILTFMEAGEGLQE